MHGNHILLFAVSRGIYSEKKRNKTNQTVQFKLEDTILFCQDAKGHLRQLPINALDEENVFAYGATLKLDNQKNEWKGVCVYSGDNGDENFIPVRALGRRCVSIQKKVSNKKT